VLNMSGSPLDVGLLNFFRLLPLIGLSLVGGSLADKIDRRKMMVATQLAAMVVSFITAALVFSPWLSLWPLLVLSVVKGILLTFDRPARQALIPSVVPREHMMNAVALHAAVRNLTGIIGPSLGGISIVLIGPQWTILANAISFIAVVAALLVMRVPPQAERKRHNGLGGGIGEGFAYVRQEPSVRAILLLTLVPMVFGVPYSSLVPVFAKDVLDVGAQGYGFLMGASGVGALLGAVGLAWRSRVSGKWMIGGALIFGLGLAGFALSPWFGLSVVVLVLVGLSNEVYFTTANSLLQMLVPDALRGRVMSVYLMDRGLVPLGSLIAGGLATLIGAPITLAVMGGACALLALAAAPSIVAVRPREAD
jgi:MFS family permease